MIDRDRLGKLLMGTDPKVRRMVAYWSATVVLYMAIAALMQVAVRFGLAERNAVDVLTAYGVCGLLLFAVLVRASAVLGIAPRLLSMLQGLFAVSCNIWLYTVSGPLREASLITLLVVITFCTFSLRPRQTMLLSAISLAGMGLAMWHGVTQDPSHYPVAIEALTFGFASVGLIAITLLTGQMNTLRARLKNQKEELLVALATIRTLATMDDLTALANRRHMNDVLADEERRQPSAGATCIALIDIDFFKDINDRFGHAQGDTVLREFAGAALGALRGSDTLARWGGEEFLLMLPTTEVAEATQVLARMAAAVAAMRLPGVELGRTVTFSAGVTARDGDEPFAETISRADKALYRAKAEGRDRVITA